MNAQEASLKTKENLENVLPQKQYDQLIEHIKYLCSIGDYSTWEEYLYKKTKELLRADGYKVTRSFIGGYNISWR